MRSMMVAVFMLLALGTSVRMPISLGTRHGSSPPLEEDGSETEPFTTTEMLNVVTMSRVMAHGAPMITSSTYLQASTPSERSCRFMMGWFGPRLALTSASVCSPTSRKSPALLALRSVSTWPGWNRSNAPSMYTTFAPGGGVRVLLNCVMRREVGQNRDTRVRSAGLAPSSAASPSPSPAKLASRSAADWASSPGAPPASSAGGARTHVSIRPTKSVVDTPSVRLIILKRPSRLTSSYASVPSGSRHGSSPCTT
mmetsp:Transcript_5785/g.20167  ORF Transcript_5785/g.20167 Transcript_5785/m.20167 type:complete len:254 (-) Transcript_5785:610-1371(-)